ncbi:type 4b pilus protein PilO2 [Gluconacetobacter sp. 1c LMG 22058]|uniref:Type 4b pilus protein PilO2 n=1 Tax=Gluconacetobacter dulcium TaxID=2729096 RepID=A0A7W4K342_9PROT|nr:type 4b pilus protein PilO2 [Gluconacetobacter dulcium]MBB2199504.1 type 4b pilus protein PilO2 [Gluconacetobacter dulcium]
MAFFIRAEHRIWCGDLRWRTYERRPSLFALRSEALALGANYTVRSPLFPGAIGFLVAEQLDLKESFHSLMLAVASTFGPRYYGEYEVGLDQFWVVATDDTGRPLPGSDTIYRDETIAAVRSGFEGFTFERRDILSRAEFETLQANLPDAPLSIRSTSLRSVYLAAAATLALALGVTEGTHVYHKHQQELVRARARKAMLDRPTKPKPAAEAPSAPPTIQPSAWVRACVSAVPSTAFHRGWVVAGVLCSDDKTTVSWARRGGSLSDAPPGDVTNNGNIVDDALPLIVAPGHPDERENTLEERDLFGFLQAAGAPAQINRSPVTLMVGNRRMPMTTTSATFAWPGDPMGVPWDQFKGLRIIEMKRAYLGSEAGPTLGAWQFKVSFTEPVLQRVTKGKAS